MWTQDKNNPHKLCRDDSSQPSSLTDLGFKEAEYPHPIAAWQLVTICIHNHKGETDSKDLSDLIIQIWKWCLSRGEKSCRTHPGSLQHIMADAEFRESFMLSD